MVKFLNFLKNKRNLVYILFSTIVFVLAAIFFFNAGNITESSLSELTLSRRQVVARAGAKEIEMYLEMASRSLVLLERRIDSLGSDSEVQASLDRYISDREGTPTFIVSLINKSGTVYLESNLSSQKGDLGTSVSEADYFIWAKKAKKGEVSIEEDNKKEVVLLATPIVKDGNFQGAIVVGISLPDFTKTYIDPLKASSESEIYLLNSNGIFLYAPFKELIGLKASDELKGIDFPGKELLEEKLSNWITETPEQKIDFVWPDRNGKLRRMLAASTKISFNNENWVLVIAAPFKTTQAFTDIYKDQIRAFIFLVLVMIGFASIAILDSRMIEKKAYERGFNDAQKIKKGEK
jgi:C4-dicarboxylate-specific signal transduction histidine kinase